MKYTKLVRDYQQLVNLLSSERGLKGAPADIEKRLQDVGYYRLSAYWYPFTKKNGDSERINTSIDVVWTHYCFDRKLRLLCIDAIERIEIALRNHLVHILTLDKKTPIAYMDDSCFLPSALRGIQAWRIKQLQNFKSNKNEFCVAYKNKYIAESPEPPFWMISECMSFGDLVKLMESMCWEYNKRLAKIFNLKKPETLISWMRFIRIVRNSCAHHSRTWNKKWTFQPALPRLRSQPEWYYQYNCITQSWEPPGRKASLSFPVNTTATFLFICRYMLKIIAPTSSWCNRTESFINDTEYKTVQKSWMGLEESWQDHPLWK